MPVARSLCQGSLSLLQVTVSIWMGRQALEEMLQAADYISAPTREYMIRCARVFQTWATVKVRVAIGAFVPRLRCCVSAASLRGNADGSCACHVVVTSAQTFDLHACCSAGQARSW